MPHSEPMNNPGLDRIYLGYRGIYENVPNGTSNPNLPGHYWKVRPHVGIGFYWYYPIDDLMAINIGEMEAYKDITVQYDCPDFYSFGKYNRNMSTYFTESRKNSSCSLESEVKILGYAWKKARFSETIEAFKPIRISGISLLPEAIPQLSSQFACESHVLASAIAELNGTQFVPGLHDFFDSLFDIRPGHISADVYYRSKIFEAVALLIDWWHEQKAAASSIQPADRTSFNLVVNHINSNLSVQITLDSLCHIACMSPSKLTGLFKTIEGKTPIEYVRQLRLAKAAKLLTYSDLPLSHIAGSLGFTHQGSFSEAFKSQHGISPLSYRKAYSPQYHTAFEKSKYNPTEALRKRYGLQN